jgi:hypothetical protein
MKVWNRRRKDGWGDIEAGGGASAIRLDSPAAEPAQATRAEADPMIDLRDQVGWAARVDPDPARAAELREQLRARSARREAQRELMRLRARHWSGERVIEEGRLPIEWWEHPEADPYAVLELMPGAPLAEVAAARRRIASRCHPDLLAARHDPEAQLAQRRMVAANAAYDRIRRAVNAF